MKLIILTLFMLGISTSAWATLRTSNIEYHQGDAVMEGYLAYDDSFSGKRPGVVVVHEWMGINDYTQARVNMLAKLGYVAFAADIYGKGVRPQTVAEAGAESARLKNDRPLMRSRAQAGLEVLKAQNNVDPSKIAAIGYCFGGTVVLELARSGADIQGVVTFHGGLSTPTPQDAGNIRAALLILHGANDPFVSAEEVAAFEQEMDMAKVPYQLIKYPGAEHGFTNPGNKGTIKGALYNKEADEKSWQEMQRFFNKVLN